MNNRFLLNDRLDEDSRFVIAYERPGSRRRSPVLAGILSVVCLGLWLAGICGVAASLVALAVSITAGETDAEVASIACILAGVGLCCVADRLGVRIPGIGTGG